MTPPAPRPLRRRPADPRPLQLAWPDPQEQGRPPQEPPDRAHQGRCRPPDPGASQSVARKTRPRPGFLLPARTAHRASPTRPASPRSRGLGRVFAQAVEERLHRQHDRPGAFAADRRDQVPRLRPAQFARRLPRRVLAASSSNIRSALFSTSQRGFSSMLRIVLAQLVLDRAHLLGRRDFHAAFHRRHVDQVQQQARALHVAQEQAAQARAFGRAFDQARECRRSRSCGAARR